MSQIQNQFEIIVNGLAENGYAIIDQFLDIAQVKEIVDLEIFRADNLRKAGIGKENKLIVEAIRGDYIKWIDKVTVDAPIQSYLNIVDKLRSFLNQNLFLSLKDFEGHLACYPPGTFYKRHLDQFKTDDHRRITLVVYLNENWMMTDGGYLRLYMKGGDLDVYPEAGKLVCFRSDLIEHEVFPANRERLSITGWFLDRLADFIP